jgi:hypothetical protein
VLPKKPFSIGKKSSHVNSHSPSSCLVKRVLKLVYSWGEAWLKQCETLSSIPSTDKNKNTSILTSVLMVKCLTFPPFIKLKEKLGNNFRFAQKLQR